MRIRSERDFWSGLLFMCIGGGFIWLATGYRLGTASRMGPAYFPIAVGSFLALLGLAITVRSFWRTGAPLGRIALRPLLVTMLAVTMFGLTLSHFGLVAAIVVLVLLGAVADRNARPVEAVVLAIFLSTFSVAVFVLLLGLPLQVWPDLQALGLMQ